MSSQPNRESQGDPQRDPQRPWRSEPAGPRFAAIDIGSDTVHMLIAELTQGTPAARSPSSSPIAAVHSESALLELGRVVGLRGRITAKAEAEVGSALGRMVRHARKSGATIVIAATEASRKADNGAEVLGRLSTRVDVPIRLLSPSREADLGFAGVRTVLPTRGDLVVIDSGGASTEVSLTRGRRMSAAASLPVGAALLAANLPGDPPEPIDWALAAVQIGATLGSLPAGTPHRAFATGGTAHGLGAIGSLKASPGPAGRAVVSIAELDRIARILLSRPARRIGQEAGIDPRRVALLSPGVLILGAILRHYGLTEFNVVQAGVREGIIRAAAANPAGWWLDPPPPGT